MRTSCVRSIQDIPIFRRNPSDDWRKIAITLIEGFEQSQSGSMSEIAWFRQLNWMPSLIIGYVRDLVSGSADATIQFLKGVGAAVVFIAVYGYWRWLPQPHSF